MKLFDVAEVLAVVEGHTGPQPAFVYDHAGHELVWANAAGLTLFDVDSLEALGTVSLPDRILRTPAKRLHERCRALTAGVTDRVNLVLFDDEGEPGELWRCEISGLFEDGSMTLFQVIPRGTSLMDSFSRDTPHGQLLSALLGDGPVEIGLKDREGHYRLVSEYAAGLTGMTAADMRGQSAGSVLPVEAARTIDQADRHVIKTGEAGHAEVATGPDNNNRVYWTLKFPVYGVDGAITGTASLATDITRVKRLQAAFESRQASILDANTNLVGGIAHQFNNLLTVILGYASLAEEADDAHQLSYLSHVQEAGTEARNLVAKLMTYTQMHANTPSTIDVIPFVQQCLARLPGELGVNVALERLPAGPVKTRIDPAQLEQMLRELLTNAVRASSDDSLVRMRIQVIRHTGRACSACQQAMHGDMLALEVQDSGPGIDPADLGHVFQPFYTTASPGEGRGLGLSVVHGIAHQNGGHVTLGASVNGGCAASVHLPLYKSVTNA